MDLALVEHGESKSAIEPQLLKDIGQMALHRLLTDGELVGDLLVAKTSRHTVDDLLLPLRELPFGLRRARGKVGQTSPAAPARNSLDVLVRRARRDDEDAHAWRHSAQAANDALRVRAERLVVEEEEIGRRFLDYFDDVVLIMPLAD